MLINKTINCYYRKYWYCFLFGILVLIGVDAVQLLLPPIIAKIVDTANQNNLTLNFITIQSLYILAIGLAIFVGRVLWRFLLNGVSVLIQADLRKRLFIHCENLPKEYHNTHKTGATMAILTNDTEAISDTFSDGVIYLVDILVLGTLAFIKMMMVNWVLSLVTIIPLILFVFSGNILEKVETRTFEAQQESFERMSDFTTENLFGISVIKAFVKEKQQIHAFSGRVNDNRKKYIRFIRFDNIYNIIINGVVYLSLIALLILGGYFATKDIEIIGIEHMTGPALTEFYGYFDSLIWPMFAIVFFVSITSRGRASCKRVSEILNTPISVKDKDGIVPTNEKITGDIEFNHLSFAYPDSEEESLIDCNFVIKKGQNVGIIGRTGSGKSTIISMLLKQYNIEDGMLKIGGVDINDLSTVDLRNSIGLVNQDPFLFSTTIAKNIAFSDETISMERIKEAAKFACIDENIEGFKDGYETVVGERGVSLSGGQKQRISMARAVIKDPEILLLDDSVSAVDSSTEKAILKNINEGRKGKTTIIIAHRISAVEDLDMIILMDKGRVVATGTHDELLKDNKMYQDIVKLQELEKEVN